MYTRYIVTFDPLVEKKSCISILEKHDFRIRHLFELIPAAVIEATPEEAQLLKNESQIERLNFDIHSNEREPIQFKFLDSNGVVRYLVPEEYDFEKDKAKMEAGKNIDASSTISCAVIDSGVDNQHPVLLGRVVEEYDLTGEGVFDFYGHGTLVASRCVANALKSHKSVDNFLKEMNLEFDSYDPKIISVKVADGKGVFWESDIMIAIELLNKIAIDREIGMIVNLSLGVYKANCTGKCPLCKIAKNASNLEILAASGNREFPFQSRRPDCPAKAKGVISVGAMDFSGGITEYSKKGSFYSLGNVKFKLI
jgi:subtilisin family serine protease